MTKILTLSLALLLLGLRLDVKAVNDCKGKQLTDACMCQVGDFTLVGYCRGTPLKCYCD